MEAVDVELADKAAHVGVLEVLREDVLGKEDGVGDAEGAALVLVAPGDVRRVLGGVDEGVELGDKGGAGVEVLGGREGVVDGGGRRWRGEGRRGRRGIEIEGLERGGRFGDLGERAVLGEFHRPASNIRDRSFFGK